jgi:hypothetical protein
MVEFSRYVPAMDRGYGKSTAADNSTNDVGVGIQEIGQAVPMGIAAQNVQGIGAKMRAGAGAIEIQFPGATRGNRQAHTPGLYGEDQRQALRELAEIAEVNLTTHASFGIMGFAGADQQGNFSEEYRKVSVDEIKRAVAFAADTAKGGSVVVHTGEFQRPISEQPWAVEEGKYVFKGHPTEEKEAVVRVVDDRTGHIIQQIRKSQEVVRPIWNKAKESGYVKATKDNEEVGYKAGDKVYIEKDQYIDYEGNPLAISQRVPEYDESTGRFRVKLQVWDDFVKEAEERNRIEAQKKGMSYESFVQTDHAIKPEETFLRATLETNAANARGWALYYGESFERYKDNIGKLRKAYEFYKRLEESVPQEERWKYEMPEGDRLGISHLVPMDRKLTSEILKDKIRETERGIEQAREASASQEAQAREAMNTITHVKSAEKYALEKSYDSYAEAGIYAWKISESKGLKDNPLIITMENIYPESYGGHPDELMQLISESRKKMAERLHEERKMSMDEAKKLAETHIKATLDTGHLNTWRKNWQDNPDKSIKENDDNFKKWMLEKVEEMAKKNMVGNVHLTDNDGYHDEHLAPGQGTTPVKEMVYILKKHGYKGALTVEPGADATTDLSDFHGLMKTWQLFGSPVYGAHGPVRVNVPKASWTDVQYSYFGQGHTPYYIFGPYAPSQDWTLWSQAPLE